LSIYEPTNPDDPRDWTLVDCFNVCGPDHAPSRGDETCFKVVFDPNATALAYTNAVSSERDQVSILVTALNEVKIFRSIVPSASGAGDGGIGGIGLGIGAAGSGISNTAGASHRLMFYEAIRLPTHPALVRSVTWASLSLRGTDRIATACKDGTVRVFELGVAPSTNPSGTRDSSDQHSSTLPTRNTVQQRQQQSSLTSAITGRQSQSASTQTATQPGGSRTGHNFDYITTIVSAQDLGQAHIDAWQVLFNPAGQVLASSGSDGVNKMWKKSVLNGQWVVVEEQYISGDGDTTDEEEEESSN
jgi:nucleoporin SEH1